MLLLKSHAYKYLLRSRRVERQSPLLAPATQANIYSIMTENVNILSKCSFY